MAKLIWLIPILPLLGVAVNGTLGKRLGKRGVLVRDAPAFVVNRVLTRMTAVLMDALEHGNTVDETVQVAEALSRAGLRPPERFFLSYPHELSGGQRQRVVVAGALVLEPEVLVADEPVSSLDASVRGEILALLLSLREDLGLSVLVVTHDLGLAWNIADRIAVMYLGRIVEIGPAADILESPQHPYTRALLSVVPEAQQMEQEILIGEAPDPTRIPAGCRFHPRCPQLASGEAAAAGVDHDCRTSSLPVLPASKEHAAACFLSVARQGMLTD
jgi:peptide/nickel transport system ATP-binding protein